ncbi:MAG: hypothetical protein ACI8QZ_002170 [Chlamydiales bacterium]|jgi:hypothetical protein
MATAPEWTAGASSSVVRADSVTEAEYVAKMLSDLEPRLLAMVPDTKLDELEVWVQDRPSLYRNPRPAVADAEGLWSESHDRILISRHADSLERTLAHELVHAALGASWRALPGSLEEGLCDAISARLAPDGAARLRAGRFSSAALGCGGLTMDLKIVQETGERNDSPWPSPPIWSARIALTSEELPTDGHLSVFKVQAGLSSSTLASTTKRGYYGLSYLLIERIIERQGLEALNELCVQSIRAGHSKVPTAWLLAAAGLTTDAKTWQTAAIESLGEREIIQLLMMYPGFVVDSLVDYLVESGRENLDGVQARLQLTGSPATVNVSSLTFIRDQVEASLAERSKL